MADQLNNMVNIANIFLYVVLCCFVISKQQQQDVEISVQTQFKSRINCKYDD